MQGETPLLTVRPRYITSHPSSKGATTNDESTSAMNSNTMRKEKMLVTATPLLRRSNTDNE